MTLTDFHNYMWPGEKMDVVQERPNKLALFHFYLVRDLDVKFINNYDNLRACNHLAVWYL